MSVQYQKCTYGSYFKVNPIENAVHILVEVSVLYFNYLVSVTASGPDNPL